MTTVSPVKTSRYEVLMISSYGNQNEIETTYKLKQTQADVFCEYDSLADLMNGLFIDHIDSIHEETEAPESDSSSLQRQNEALQELITISRTKLDALRFLMTDRITSAMTRVALLQTHMHEQIPPRAKRWLNEGVTDLAELSLILEEWNDLSEQVQPKQLDTLQSTEKMVSEVKNRKPPSFV